MKPPVCAARACGVGTAGESECGGRERMRRERANAAGESECRPPAASSARVADVLVY